MAHQYTQLDGIVRNGGGEKLLQSRIDPLTEIADHFLLDIGRHRWSARWTQGAQPQTLVYGVHRGLARHDV